MTTCTLQGCKAQDRALGVPSGSVTMLRSPGSRSSTAWMRDVDGRANSGLYRGFTGLSSGAGNPAPAYSSSTKLHGHSDTGWAKDVLEVMYSS